MRAFSKALFVTATFTVASSAFATEVAPRSPKSLAQKLRQRGRIALKRVGRANAIGLARATHLLDHVGVAGLGGGALVTGAGLQNSKLFVLGATTMTVSALSFKSAGALRQTETVKRGQRFLDSRSYSLFQTR